MQVDKKKMVEKLTGVKVLATVKTDATEICTKEIL